LTECSKAWWCSLLLNNYLAVFSDLSLGISRNFVLIAKFKIIMNKYFSKRCWNGKGYYSSQAIMGVV
jgi:hypothetical protein